MSALTFDRPTPRVHGRAGWWPALVRWCARVHRTAAERRSLADLDDHLLADIGLDRATMRAEAARPFWDLPDDAWSR